MVTAITSTELFPALFVAATFRSGPVYLWSGQGSITWNGQTWTGLGALGGVSQVEEGSTVEAKGLTLTLSGFDAALLPDVMNEFGLLLPVTVYLGCFNEGELIATPITMFAGRMDQPTVEVDSKTATISINCETVLLDMNVATDRRYTPEDQQRDWPGDLGMTFVPSISEVTIYFGTAPTSSANV